MGKDKRRSKSILQQWKNFKFIETIQKECWIKGDDTMPKGIKEDLTGLKFGKLTVISFYGVKNKKSYWLCECDCEDKNQKVARSDQLKDGITKSCGCSIKLGTHGMSNTRLFNIWSGIRSRCNNKNSKDYHNYGGRGVKICDEWENDFSNFYNWAIKNGYSDDLTIDRKNTNGNYEPSNCRWATHKEQSNNLRRNFNIEINGEVKSISEWSQLSGVHRPTIKKRIKEGLSGEELIAPVIKSVATKQSGVKNVKWDKSKERWKVDFKINGKVKHIGYFEKLDDAIKAKENYLLNTNNEE